MYSESVKANLVHGSSCALLGYGLRCHRAIKEIAVLLGIKDMRCKVRGPTTPLSLVRAAFQGLLSQVKLLGTRTERLHAERFFGTTFRPKLGSRLQAGSD